MVDVAIVTSEADIQTCFNLRHIVFVEEQNVPVEEELDGKDNDCTHILAKVGGEAIGAARFYFSGDFVKIQRVCVLKEQRGTGIGASIIRKILDHAKSEGSIKYALLSSQSHALSFYEALGFTAFGDEYLDAGILHRDMKAML